MVKTRSKRSGKNIKKIVIKKKKQIESDSSSNESDLEYLSNDISEYITDESDESDESDECKESISKCSKSSEDFRKKGEKIQKDLDDTNSQMLSHKLHSNTRVNNLVINLNSNKKRPRTRSQTKLSKKTKKHKDDNDASDIDLEVCSSAENDPDYTQDDVYKTFVDEVVENMVDDAHIAIQQKKAYLRSKRWKKDLSLRDIEKYDEDYKSICDKISEMPMIVEILQIDMPFKTKCDLMEKLIILDNIPSDTFDHLHLKNSIKDELAKYKKSNLDKQIYTQYNDIERKLEESDYVDLPLKYKILGSDMSFNNKVAVYRKYKHWINLQEQSSEHPKLLNWINTAIDLPTKIEPLPVSINDKNCIIAKFLYDVKYKLNTDVYGMENAKEQIICVLNNKITNPNLIGSALALQGVQGSGKTKLIQVLSKAINIPLTSIPLGGATDSGFLIGHGFTYEGSRCGCIVDSLIKMKTLSGIIFFDEIDKISKTRWGEEVSKSLLHITDFTQNHEFTDKYLGNDIIIDLSNMWFIYSLNYTELLDKTLADRIPIIQVEGYTNTQKLEMSMKYLIPEALKWVCLKKDDVSFSEQAINYLIEETNKMYTHETRDKNGNSGVRKLKDAIGSVITKLNFLKNTILEDGTYGDLKTTFTIPNFKIPFVVKREHIDKLKILHKNQNSTPMGMYI